jgi:predicted short-subunit dehydrogenase-like oxidoreductase (DUF2520 family)
MAGTLKIAIVGPGRLGHALALELKRAGYSITEILSRSAPASRGKARRLAGKIGARVSTSRDAELDANVVWLCVPDRTITAAARGLAAATDWKGKIAFHSSGALTSDELDVLRKRGAAVASVHPLMTFVSDSAPSLTGVPIAIEGDAAALSMARRIVRGLRGDAFLLPRERKAAYHAWGAFASPLLLALLVTAEQVAQAAGIPPTDARRKMLPIVRQTIANYAILGPAGALSGPIVRGDAEIVKRHLQAIKETPEASDVYVALARAALRYLPAGGRAEIRKMLGK